MRVKPIANGISDDVFNQMKDLILSGEWPVGSKIPTEPELGALFNVSRITIRHAVQKLVGMGILRIKRGDGTYVTDVDLASAFGNLYPLLVLSKQDYKEIYEFRMILEVENARLAAKRATEEDIEKLKGYLVIMKESGDDLLAYSQADIAFHTQIAQATHNSFVMKTTSVINEMLYKMMFAGVKTVGTSTGIYYHEQIIKAIEERNSKAAARIIREHISDSAKKVLKGVK